MKDTGCRILQVAKKPNPERQLNSADYGNTPLQFSRFMEIVIGAACNDSIFSNATHSRTPLVSDMAPFTRT
jgi:hypothetical protein